MTGAVKIAVDKGNVQNWPLRMLNLGRCYGPNARNVPGKSFGRSEEVN